MKISIREPINKNLKVFFSQIIFYYTYYYFILLYLLLFYFLLYLYFHKLFYIVGYSIIISKLTFIEKQRKRNCLIILKKSHLLKLFIIKVIGIKVFVIRSDL